MSRGEYRSIHTVLIDDPDFQRLDPDAKLVWYTLKMQLGPSGIGTMTAWHAVVGEQTGLTPERLQAAVEELVEEDRLRVQENVFWLRNGLKYDPSLTLSNDNHAESVMNHLLGLPKLEIVNAFAADHDLEEPWPEIGCDYPHEPPTPPHPPSHTPPHGGPIPDQGIRKTEDGSRKTESSSEGSSLRSSPSGASADGNQSPGNRWSETVTACREHLWLAKEPPGDRTVGQELSVAKQLTERWNLDPPEVAEAVEGFALLREQGEWSGWVEPKDPASLLALNRTPDDSQGIPVMIRSLHEVRKAGPTERSGGMERVSA